MRAAYDTRGNTILSCAFRENLEAVAHGSRAKSGDVAIVAERLGVAARTDLSWSSGTQLSLASDF